MEIKKLEKKIDKINEPTGNRPETEKWKKYQEKRGGNFKKGNPGGPGHPIGVRNWETIYWEAIKRLAKRNKIDPDDLDLELVEKGILEARKGNFNFWKEIKEANFGKIKEQVEHSGSLTIGEFLNKLNEK